MLLIVVLAKRSHQSRLLVILKLAHKLVVRQSFPAVFWQSQQQLDRKPSWKKVVQCGDSEHYERHKFATFLMAT